MSNEPKDQIILPRQEVVCSHHLAVSYIFLARPTFHGHLYIRVLLSFSGLDISSSIFLVSGIFILIVHQQRASKHSKGTSERFKKIVDTHIVQ
jgi:hypothetical protein